MLIWLVGIVVCPANVVAGVCTGVVGGLSSLVVMSVALVVAVDAGFPVVPEASVVVDSGALLVLG